MLNYPVSKCCHYFRCCSVGVTDLAVRLLSNFLVARTLAVCSHSIECPILLALFALRPIAFANAPIRFACDRNFWYHHAVEWFVFVMMQCTLLICVLCLVNHSAIHVPHADWSRTGPIAAPKQPLPTITLWMFLVVCSMLPTLWHTWE